jgi:hypothetical protein
MKILRSLMKVIKIKQHSRGIIRQCMSRSSVQSTTRRPCAIIMLPSRIMKMKLLEGSLGMRLRETRLLKIKTIAVPNKIDRRPDKASHNMELDFFRMVGHNVYTMPLENLLAAENVIATRTNPNPDD